MQRCHTYKIAGSKYQGRCEQRSEVFVKIHFFFSFFFFWGGGVRSGEGCSGGGRGRVEGVRVDVIEELKFLGKSTKKKKFWGGRYGGVRVGGGSGWM